MKTTTHRIFSVVTNDLSQDQRMQRICSSLSHAGYDVTLLGRRLPWSKALSVQPFTQKRLPCYFKKGKLFYLEYNIRIFFFFLFLRRYNAVCAVDLDTLLAISWACWFRRKPCIYDAHEYFTELPEVIDRPKVQAVWAWVARRCIPKVKAAYTVCQSLSEVFKTQYGRDFEVIRNVPFAQALYPNTAPPGQPCILLYQGALNEGRGLEELLQAMQYFDADEVQLWLAGEGDLSTVLRQQADSLKLGSRVRFLGFVMPADLKEVTKQAHVGLNLLQNKGLNYYYSLANKFFDYVQAEKPSINMDFPEYRRHCAEFKTGLLIPDLAVEALVAVIQKLLKDPNCYMELQANCRIAKSQWIWELEEKKLLAVYEKVFAKPVKNNKKIIN